MSWSEGSLRRMASAAFRLGAVVPALLFLLSACGFQPLYAERGPEEPGVSQELASIRVLPISNRSGQQLYNMLVDRLTPYGRPGDPEYLLTVRLATKTERLAFRTDETATRANLNLRARYQLRRASDGAVVFSGMSRSTSSYDILENPFATTVSEDDAFDRAARELSEEIRTRLAVFLSSTVADAP